MKVEDLVDNIARRRYTRWNISLSELSKDRLAQGKHLHEPDNANLLRAMLFKYGMDIDKHFEVEVCEHRNIFGEKVHCHYFLGIERTDTRWTNIKSGLVSGRWKAA